MHNKLSLSLHIHTHTQKHTGQSVHAICFIYNLKNKKHLLKTFFKIYKNRIRAREQNIDPGLVSIEL